MAPSSPNPDAIFDAIIPNRSDPAALRKRVETLEILLERSFTIPGINRPVGLDAIVGLGAIPLVGDAFDLFFRSNTRNLNIIKRHLDKHHPGTMIIDQ
jgi:hypothetical protein